MSPPSARKSLHVVAKHSRYSLDLYNTCARGSALTNVPNFVSCSRTCTPTATSISKQITSLCCPNRHLTHPNPNRHLTHPRLPARLKIAPIPSLIDCLVNRSHTLKDPKQKKSIDKPSYYAHRNYKTEQIPLDSVCEETLLKGYQFIPGEFIDTHDTGIRDKENWVSQQVFLVEFDDTTESTLAEFIAARPFLRENAWLVTESLRSRYDDPHDAEV